MPAMPQPPSLQRRLRQRTAETHVALENTPLMRAFAADSLSIPVYGTYLALQWQLHAPLEALLTKWLPADWAALRLRKSDWLFQDLQAIGMRPAPSIAAAGGVDSWAEALGILYVLEGSTLGLQVVRKQVQAKHPVLQAAGRFMLGYGAETGRHWRDFLLHLETVAPADWPLAEEAASDTFDRFLRAFSLAEARGV